MLHIGATRGSEVKAVMINCMSDSSLNGSRPDSDSSDSDASVALYRQHDGLQWAKLVDFEMQIGHISEVTLEPSGGPD